jgi:hypothetical protein
MRPFMQMLAVLAVVLCGAMLAKGEEIPKSVRVLPNGDEIRCYGTYCKRFPAAQAVLSRVVESVPTPADIIEKPTETIGVASPAQPLKSVLSNPMQATRNTVQAVRTGKPVRRLIFRR